MHCNAFAANGIDRKAVDGSAQRGRSVIYDCLVVLMLFAFVVLGLVFSVLRQEIGSEERL